MVDTIMDITPETYVDLHPQIVLLPGLISADHCAELIARGQQTGYEDAPITTHIGPIMRKDIRDNTRAIIFDQQLADELYGMILPAIHANGNWTREHRPVGLNEMFRFYRYIDGQVFNWHRDGPYKRPDRSATSRLTFMIYLDEKCEGGATEFSENDISVQPKTGSGLLFLHRLLHRGAPVTGGVKHVLRSDVMFADG